MPARNAEYWTNKESRIAVLRGCLDSGQELEIIAAATPWTMRQNTNKRGASVWNGPSRTFWK